MAGPSTGAVPGTQIYLQGYLPHRMDAFYRHSWPAERQSGYLLRLMWGLSTGESVPCSTAGAQAPHQARGRLHLRPETSWAGSASLTCSNTGTLSQVVASQVMPRPEQKFLPFSGKS